MACFMRGSQRMAKMMLRNKIIGPHLRDYYIHRAISVKTKIVAIGALWVSMAISSFVIPILWPKLLLLVIATSVSIYLLRFKTRR